MFERLEDRRLLAVMKGDIALAIDAAQTEFDQAFDQVLIQNGLDVDLPIFDKKLSEAFDLSVLTSEAVQTGVDFLTTNQAPDAALTVAQALPLLSSRTGGEIAAVNSSVSDAAVEFDLVITVDLTDVEIPLPSSIDFGAIGIEITLPSVQPFQSSVQLTARTRLRIEDATVTNDTDGISNEASPSSTNITFGANLSAAPVQLDGDVAGVLAYKGQIDFRYAPSVVADFGLGNSFIPLTQLDGELNRTTVQNESTIIVPVVIELDPSDSGAAKYLPELGYKTEFLVDVANASIGEDPAKAKVLFRGAEIAADHPDLRLAIIDNYAEGMVSKITEMIPDDVRDLLLGKTDVFAGLDINDLIGAKFGLGYDTPLDALFFLGVPQPVIDTVELILEVADFGTNSTPDETDKLGITFPIVKDPVAGVLDILAGRNTDLAIWRVNLVEKVLASYGFEGQPDKLQLKSDGFLLKVSDERLQVKFDFEQFKDDLKKRVSDSVGGVAADIVDYLATYLTKGLTGALSFDLGGRVEIGADTHFLTVNGGTLSDFADTFFIDTTEPILDLGFQIDVTASLAGAVGFGLSAPRLPTINDAKRELGNAKDCVGNAKQCVEDAADNAQNFINSITDSAGNIIPGLSFEDLEDRFKDAVVDLREGVGFVAGELTEAGKQAVDKLVELGEQGWEILTKLIGDLLSAEISLKLGLEAELALEDGAEPGKLRAGEFIADPLSKVCLLVGMNGGISAKSNFLGEIGYDVEIDFIDIPCVKTTTGGNNGDPKRVEEWFAEPIGSTIFIYGTASADDFRITKNTNGDILLFNGGAYQVFDFDPSDPDRIQTVHVDLRGELTPVDNRVDDTIRSKDGGNDSVTIASVFFDEIAVVVNGGSGSDVITAYDSRNDNFYDGEVAFSGGGGNDTLTGGNGPTNILLGDHESDLSIFGDDTINAGPGPAILLGQRGNDLLRGLQPNLDTENGSGGTMSGGLGFDQLDVGDFSDGDWLLVGGELVAENGQPTGADAGGFILGGPKDDTIIGGHAIFDAPLTSFVPILGTGDRSWLSGGPGDDFVFGTAGNDFLIGGELSGQSNSGADFLSGFEGTDLLSPANITTTRAVGIWAPYEVDFDENASQGEVILGGDLEDLFLIGPGLTDLSLYGGAENDVFLFSDNFVSPNGKVDEIGGDILIDGGGGNENRIAFNDLGGAAKNVVISASQITGLTDATISYRGVFDEPSTHDGIIVNASERNDEFLVSSVDVGDTWRIVANGGDDSFSVASTQRDNNGTLDDIRGRLSIIGGEDNDRIYLNDRSADNAAEEFHYLIEPDSVTDLPHLEASDRTFEGVFFDGTTEDLRLDGTDAANVFDVSPSVDTKFFIDGNLPETQRVCAADGDFLRLNTEGTLGRKLTITDVGDGFWSFDQPHQPVFFESIERFNHVDIIAVTEPAGAGSEPRVRVFDAETLEFKFEFLAYELDYENGVQVAVGDVNEDGLPDVVTIPGRLRAPDVRVFNGAPMVGAQGSEIPELGIPAMLTYGDEYLWGGQVAVGDVTGDGCNEIVTASGRNIETVKVFGHDPGIGNPNISQKPFTEIASFEPFEDLPQFMGGAYVAVADFDGDDDGNRRGDIVVGAGSGLPSKVRVFESDANLTFTQTRQIDDPEQDTEFGLQVTTGDINGDEIPDIITSRQSRGSSQVHVYDGQVSGSNTPIQTLTAFTDPSQTAPVLVSSADFNEDGLDDLYTTQGPDGRNDSEVRVFDQRNDQIGLVDTLSESQVSLAIQLDHDIRLTGTLDSLFNLLSLQEKWFSSETGQTFYLTPAGDFFQSNGANHADSELIASIDNCVYLHPPLLHQAFDTYLAANSDAEARVSAQGYAEPSLASTIVTNTLDLGPGSLRAAIEFANENPGPDSILFDIPGDGVHTITVNSALPTITDTVIIDGTNEPGFQDSPVVQIDGTTAGTGVNGFTIDADFTTIRGLVISGFTGNGLEVLSDHNIIAGNYIGTDATGLADQGNSRHGILVRNASGNTIGGLTQEDRNIVSGNDQFGIYLLGSGSTDNDIRGNFIGTDVTGLSELGNFGSGIVISNASFNLIGGRNEAARNVISGNLRSGIYLIRDGATDNQIAGNYIGTDVTGTRELGNRLSGVVIQDGSNNTVGAIEEVGGNIISANGEYGVRVFGTRAGENLIANNYIGTTTDGLSDLGNTLSGVLLSNSSDNGVDSNVISGNDQFGVYILGSGSTNNTIEGNFIGTDATGSNAIGNRGSGIVISNASRNLIGGTTPSAGNVISGNLRSGVYLLRDSANDNRIEGNYIGTDSTGMGDVGNRLSGVVVQSGANNTIGGTAVGAGNRIANNGADGISILNNQAFNNAITRNSIESNVGLGIDLGSNGAASNDAGDADTGANRLQNTATSLGVEVTVTGSTALIEFEYQVDTLPANATFPLTVEFFLSDASGQGIHFLTDDIYSTADQSTGLKLFSQSFPISSFSFTPEFGSATVTDAAGNTSEFSSAVPITLAAGGMGEPLALLAPTPKVAYDSLDVNRNGDVTSIDALMVINALNESETSKRTDVNEAIIQLDVNRDGSVTALDALLVINQLNQKDSASTELSVEERFDAVFAEMEQDAFNDDEILEESLLF
ncbi:dockerin type I domain-containing protein [Neorhodopirellula lusitana]|uniref:dockerin type I domain-containing protein n=1 Tax=Neorhodopirellula lusitana TaxID=445327 RepID=UPI0024B82A72|nr:dockerin type I domain-containing protein [Neorhodopirellula lusitana]